MTKRDLQRIFPALTSLYADVCLLRGTAKSASLIQGVALAAQANEIKCQAGQLRVAVINSVRTYIRVQLCVEMILALKLRSRGYDVKILYDDGVLLHHDTLTKIDHRPFRTGSWLRRIFSIRFLRKLPVIGGMLTPYSEFLTQTEARKIASGPEPIGQASLLPYVEASLVRFFLSAPDHKILSSEPDYERANRMFTSNTLISRAVASRVVERLNPVLMLTSHGIYSTWGCFMRQMMDSGVRAVCWGSNGYATDKIDLAVNDVAANKADGGFFEHLAEKALRNEDFMTRVCKTMGDMLDGRINGTASDIARLGLQSNESGHPVLDRITVGRAQGKQIFALFPNVMWDNATTFKEWNRVFDSPVEWLIETVKFFAEADNKLLVVRAHPAEYLWMTVRKGIKEILISYLGNEILDHQNIIFIPPEEKFSSYRLFEHLSGGTVYNGTIGPELIHAGIPLILGARAAYSDKGFTHDCHSREEYFEAYEKTEQIGAYQKKNIRRAMLFLYEYFYLHGVKVHFMDDIPGFVPRYDGDPIKIWTDPGLEQATATLTGEREFFQTMPEELIRHERVVQ